MSNDTAVPSALWLVAGGAAGLAVGRFVVAPLLAKKPALPQASSSPAVVSAPKPRALSAAPSGAMGPLDPYAARPIATGPSGEMRPLDPYADVAPRAPVIDVQATQATPTSSTPSTCPSSSSSGPITMPCQVEASSATGPITRPSQVETTRPITPTAIHQHVVPAPVPSKGIGRSFATSERVRRFDPVFDRYRGSLPIEYVRALVDRESEGDPTARNGTAIGLMQIRPAVLADYNKRHGTAYSSEHLTDPAINVAIGCELLSLIIDSYRRHHPKLRSLQADWNNLRFVELLTFGWNAGFSEAGGVGRVAAFLELLSASDTNIGQVSTFAEHAGAVKELSNPSKVAWCKSVAALYQRERALTSR